MLCENCQLREASVHVKQSHNNQITEYNLCSVCAREMEQSSHSSFSDIFGDFFNSMFWGPSGFTYPRQRVQTRESLQCPNCGLTERELLKQGFLGCPRCYEVFSKVLQPVFQRVQGHTCQPAAEVLAGAKFADEAQNLTATAADPIAQLRQEQQKAIAAEDYEQAARLRDEIKEREQAASTEAEELSADSPSEPESESGAEEEAE
ncbi:MAG: hypothetical protein GX681_01920 [Clostridiaceae bacterium]|nr:hypothetical protein [Clostridiaceae bacterium]